jgi:hypothetical protein
MNICKTTKTKIKNRKIRDIYRFKFKEKFRGTKNKNWYIVERLNQNYNVVIFRDKPTR